MKLFRLGYPWMILWVCTIHVVIAMGLVFRPETDKLLIIAGLNRFTQLPYVNDGVLAGLLILGALLAMVGIEMEGHWRPKACLALLMLQYGVVLASFGSDLLVIYRGINPANGVPVDRALIIVILAPIMLAGPYHTLSIVERFVLEPRRNG